MTVQRHRPPRAAVALAVIAAGGLAAAEAEAGAWTREPGDLQVISTFGHHGAPLRAGEDDDDVETVTSQIYAEYGLMEGLTVGGKFWTDIAPGDVDAGSAALGGFVRKRLWQSDGGSVVSAQVGALAPVESLLDEDFGRSKPFSTTEVELRGLYGKSWWGDWGSAFLSTEGGYQVRFEDQPHELRLDVTGGIEPFDCCMGLIGVYGLLPVSEGLTDTSLRLAPSLVWHIRGGSAEPETRRTSLQLGTAYDVLQPEDGFGVFVGVWQEF